MSDLSRGDKYYWRLVATGLCFAAFGAGGLLMGIVVFPIMAIAPISPRTRKESARKLIRRLFILFIRMMTGSGAIRCSIQGSVDLAEGGNVIMANHPSLIDVIFLISMFPTAACIVKRELFSNPFTWGPVKCAGYISNEDPGAMIDECVEELSQGYDLVVFPEGSRTPPGSKPQFKRGAARIATLANRPIVPAVITCRPSTLTKGEKWYSIPKNKRPEFLISFERVMTPVDAPGEDLSVQARKLNRELTRYYERKLYS